MDGTADLLTLEGLQQAIMQQVFSIHFDATFVVGILVDLGTHLFNLVFTYDKDVAGVIAEG